MMFRCFALLIFLGVAVPNLVQCVIYRLPKSVKPVRYFLTMEPNLTLHLWDPAPYYGSIVIELKAMEETKHITFHSSDITIDDASIRLVSAVGAEINVVTTSSNTNQEIYTVHLEKGLVKNEYYNLTIGNFNNTLKHAEGFFLARYWIDHAGDPRGIAATHFEPTGARKAFPCFDEPAMKARFVISLIRREGYVSLSNENLDRTEDLGNGRFKDTFRETPEMSSFIVAFTVSDFKSTKKLERHRIFARPEAVDKGELDYSLETSVKTLQILEEFTGINFTLDKIDSFAVPSGYFDEHAMENWGLVVYGEEHIRYSNKSYSHIKDKKRITTYIAHEFAHQWFGNLVTPEWWDYLWLSESFAAYCQYYIASLVQPSWRLMDQFVIDMMLKSFHEEEFSYSGTEPMNGHIKRSGQYPLFHIMYQKGSVVVRMMSHFLSQELFRKGLHIYLHNRQFNTALPSDLYQALQEAVDTANANSLLENQSVADIMGTWDSLTGFPIVTVTRNYTTGSITLVQSTKFKHGNTKKNWRIPINYVFSVGGELDFSKTAADFWLTGDSRTVNKNFSTDGWLLVNKQQTGYYRVNYDAENWERIIELLKSDKFESIHVLNRAQLINDAFYLAYHNELPVETPLRMCEYLTREKDYIPFAAFYSGLSSYLGMYNGRGKPEEQAYFKNHPLKNSVSPFKQGGYDQEYKIFQQYIRTLTKNVRDYLGDVEKPDEPFLDKINRIEINRYFPLYFVDERDDDDYV